ncbi:hypothetical protein BDV59DRAFT_169655 [Aspergillus ambiguus]|uniref:Zn(II)2Cys6 transcription factor n=1 Tax=Aspergillus ambiguus TaxID=176160 RepID=UPI003CCDFCE7
MKRKFSEIPGAMLQPWSRAPLSCNLCRRKKLRCDRNSPCSNCTQRDVECLYAGQDAPIEGSEILSASGKGETAAFSPAAMSQSGREQANRLDQTGKRRSRDSTMKENQTVLLSQSPALRGSTMFNSVNGETPENLKTAVTPFGTQMPPDIRFYHESFPNIASIARCLPPLMQARMLFSHFVCCLQPSFCVLHVPSTRALLEQIYHAILEGEELSPAGLVLLFSIFAGAALAWTPSLLDSLNVSETENKVTLNTYIQLVLSIVDTKLQDDASSTLSLLAMTTSSYVLSYMDGFSDKVNLLRTRTLLMARGMQIHRLDTSRRKEERRINGYNLVEIEVQRRIWWYIVSSDWLLALTGGTCEGSYLAHPSHMSVNYPSNVDDDLIPASETPHGFPVDIPTSTTVFIYRIRLSELCREAVDTMPSVLLESPKLSSSGVSYDSILALDAKFQNLLSELPIFFRLDPSSIQQSVGICEQRPYIAWQRIFLHFGIHTRICRLHHPFHLEGFTNPRYAYSREICILSAETVLGLRRSMDDAGALINLKPSHFWLVVQHVFLAAIILATDVSLGPNMPGANFRKTEVLGACDMLEKSQHESNALKNAIQKNTQTLMMILQNQAPSMGDLRPHSRLGPSDAVNKQTSMHRASEISNNPTIDVNELTIGSPVSDTHDISWTSSNGGALRWPGELPSQPGEQETWSQLWSDIFNVSLDVDNPQWGSLLDNMTFTELSEIS